jgi:ElaB/YqjD/DUF883 family membrane-anchored ribosome-binding protein
MRKAPACYRRRAGKATGAAGIFAGNSRRYGTIRRALLYNGDRIIDGTAGVAFDTDEEDDVMAKAATPATKKAAPRAKAPAKAGATKAAPARNPATVKAAKDHPIRDQLAATRDTIKTEAGKKAASLKDEATTLANQASTKARDAAAKGKDKAAEAVGSLAKMLEDSAGTVDSKFGKQYGDYARSAASTVAGLASTLDQKDLDELAASTRDFVKKSPAVAVGAAAVIGFVLARMLKGSNNG